MTLALWAILLGTAFVGALVLGLVYYVLHYSGPTVALPEFYSRPIYYGVGFACYQLATGVVALLFSLLIPTVPPWAVWFGFAIIGGGGGLGMFTAYTLHAQADRAATTRNAVAAQGTIDHD